MSLALSSLPTPGIPLQKTQLNVVNSKVLLVDGPQPYVSQHTSLPHTDDDWRFKRNTKEPEATKTDWKALDKDEKLGYNSDPDVLESLELRTELVDLHIHKINEEEFDTQVKVVGFEEALLDEVYKEQMKSEKALARKLERELSYLRERRDGRTAFTSLLDYVQECLNFHGVGEHPNYEKQFIAQFADGIPFDKTKVVFVKDQPKKTNRWEY